jgi:hypothetical protein
MKYLLLFILIQDADVGALLKQLEDESIETREKAAASLVELGDKAEERVRKHLETVEGELKARCEAILRSIQARRRLSSVLPPLKLVSLDAKEAKLRDVLEDLQKQSGMAMQLDGLADAPVTVQVKDVPPLEALNAVCKAAELGWFIDGQPVKGRIPPPAFGDVPPRGVGPSTIRFQSNGYIDVPRFFARHYSVSPTNLSINRWSDFRATSSSASLQLRLSWTPEVKPETAWIEVKRITDDKGRSLFEPVKGAVGGKFRAGMMGGGIFRSQTDAAIPLTFPEADARSIASVKGTAIAQFVVAEKTIVFDSPEGTSTNVKDLEGMTVELLECRTTAGTASVKLAIRGRARTTPEGQPYQQAPPVRLKLDDGTTAPGSGTSLHSDGTTSRYDLTFHRVSSKIAAIEVVAETTYHTDSFDFELKDIPLPK